MILYECYDETGELKACFKIKVPNLEQIVLNHNGVCYRPVAYDLVNQIAKCIPQKVVYLTNDDMVEQEPAFPGDIGTQMPLNRGNQRG
jgi:hypothetical protein